MAWKKVNIVTDNGETVDAVAPEIISASRSTDIPAFYLDWFMNRIKIGYSVWTNPFNNQKQYVSYEKCKFIVFWSKNPIKLIEYADFLKERDIKIYIQYTLNDYVSEDLEPNVPPVDERIENFKKLVEVFGKGSVIWRFDPLILVNDLFPVDLLKRIEYIGDKLYGYTDKLVFSFADISTYPKVERNLKQYNVNYREWDYNTMDIFARELARLNGFNGCNWNYTLATCSEKIDLKKYGIKHNRCIDDELITRIAYKDNELMNFLGMRIHTYGINLFDEYDVVPEGAIWLNLKQYAVRSKMNIDNGQRQLCGCISSKDIGEYNTCIHQCKYCYANTNNDVAMKNYHKHLENPNSETITGE